MQARTRGHPIVVASFDDRFNVVGGLTLKQRLRMLRGIEVVISGGAQGSGRPADEEQFALWAALHVLHRLMAAKRLTWTNDAGAGGERIRPGYSVLNLLPATARRSDVPGDRIARLVNTMRARLERQVFGDGVFASNHDLQAASLHALSPDTHDVVATPRRLVSLPNDRGSFSHKSVAHVLRYYGLGQSAKSGGRRGYLVAHWHLRQLLGLAAEAPALDLRALPWRRGAYALTGA